MLPSLFLSHGSPRIILDDCPARDFLASFGATLPRPRAIAVATAHWNTRVTAVGSAAAPKTIHDFGRFDERLFEMHYDAPGAPDISNEVVEMFATAGLNPHVDPNRGYDHGVWVPLMLMYPQADIPVIPIAVQPYDGPQHHYDLGRALTKLREQDVLVIGSGSFTHDLHRVWSNPLGAEPPRDVELFSDWMDSALTERRVDDLLEYRTRAPFAVENHPTEEHLLPLFTALGAGGDDAKVQRVHASSTYGVLRMDAYAFG